MFMASVLSSMDDFTLCELCTERYGMCAIVCALFEDILEVPSQSKCFRVVSPNNLHLKTQQNFDYINN